MTSSRILVTFATRYGSTGEIAESVGEVLRVSGFRVDVIPMSENPALPEYQGIVIGSPLYMGKLLKEAVTFIIEQKVSLGRVPVAVFIVAYSLKDRTAENIQNAEFALHVVRNYIAPVDVGLFAGKVNPDQMTKTDREIIRLGNVVPGDYRDWDSISRWALKISGILE